MDPYTGRVLAMVGGFSFDQSEFNRATQAMRQPGSSFKPIVYAAALDNGYTPSSIVLDEPIAIDQGNGEIWTPKNFEGKSGGPHTLRFGVEHSSNLMTVRLARDIGMPLITEYAKRFGVYDNLPPYLVDVAGRRRDDGAAHGHRLFDVRQRRQAHQGDADRPHPGPLGQHDLPARRTQLPELRRRRVGQPGRAQADRQARAGDRPADRLPDHLDHGGRHPARHRHRDQASSARTLAGKTGTTNDAKDLWFVGFSPDLAFGVFMGYDKPRSLGDSAQAALYAAPIFRDFMKMALKDTPDTPFRVPPGIKLISVDVHSGMRSSGPGSIIEAFKPGTAPPDAYFGDSADRRANSFSPDVDKAGRARERAGSIEPVSAGAAADRALARASSGLRCRVALWHIRQSWLGSCAPKPKPLVEQIKQSMGLLRRHL